MLTPNIARISLKLEFLFVLSQNAAPAIIDFMVLTCQ